MAAALEYSSQRTEKIFKVFTFSFKINIAILQMTLYLFPLQSKYSFLLFVMIVEISSHVFSLMCILARKKTALVNFITPCLKGNI